MKKLFMSFLICAALIISAAAQAAEFGGVGGKPAHPDPNIPHSKQWFIYTLNPGETRQDELIVQNNGDEKTDVILYPVDSTPGTDGGFALEQEVEQRDFIGKWIKLSLTSISLGPNESAIVPFSISVPDDPKLGVGEYTGGIIVQKTNQQAEGGSGLQLLTRTGVRVYATIPGDIVKKLEIEKFEARLDKERGAYIASLTVKNSGNTSRDIAIKTSVSALWPYSSAVFKKFFGDFPIENERQLQVLRNDSFISNFEFRKPLFGKLNVAGAVSYENGAETLAAEPITIKVPLDRGIITLGALTAALIAFTLAFLFIRRKK